MNRSRAFLLGLAVVATIATIGTRSRRIHEELRLFPSRPAFLFSYDDRAVGGVSGVRRLERLDSGIRFTFRLGPTRSAFAGAGVDLSGPGRNRKGIDLGGFDALELTLKARSSLNLKVVLTGFDSTIWKDGDWLSRRYSDARIEVPPGGRVRIPLERFQLSGWWRDRGLVPLSDTARSLDQLQTLEVQAVAARKPADGSEDTILIRDVRAVKDRPWVPAWVWMLPGVIWAWFLALVVLDSVRRRRSVVLRSVAPWVRGLEPTPLRLGNESDELLERFSRHLESNYHRSELDADTLCRETGIPRSRLPEIVRSGFGTTFKAHLNELRLKEAARLLRATDRGVAEIGFAVGYNSVAHFHRVFRERFGAPPGEFRSRPDASSG